MGTFGNLAGGAALAAICLAPMASADTHLILNPHAETALLSTVVSGAPSPVDRAIGALGRVLFAESASVRR